MHVHARRYAGRKVMLGVDRLDMIKGIPQVRARFPPCCGCIYIPIKNGWRPAGLPVCRSVSLPVSLYVCPSDCVPFWVAGGQDGK